MALARAKRDFVQKQIGQDRLELETNIKQTIQQFKNLQEELELVQQLKKVAQYHGTYRRTIGRRAVYRRIQNR